MNTLREIKYILVLALCVFVFIATTIGCFFFLSSLLPFFNSTDWGQIGVLIAAIPGYALAKKTYGLLAH